jgi:hypothetical protein
MISRLIRPAARATSLRFSSARCRGQIQRPWLVRWANPAGLITCWRGAEVFIKLTEDFTRTRIGEDLLLLVTLEERPTIRPRDPVGDLACHAVVDFLEVPDIAFERPFKECLHEQVGNLPAVLDGLTGDLILLEQVAEAGGQGPASGTATGVGIVARTEASFW